LTFLFDHDRLRLVTRSIIRIVIPASCLTLIALVAGCNRGGLYNVKPFVKIPPMPSSAKTADVGALSFRASPLFTDEESQELFESNLHLAGLLPVRIEIVHNSGDPIELKKLKFVLRETGGAEWKAMPAKKAIARILKANGVYAYNPNSRKIFEKEFGAYELDLKSPLDHSKPRREGFLFFQSPKKEPVASPHGLVLAIDGLPQPVSLTLN
jgi:hypothetical protein